MPKHTYLFTYVFSSSFRKLDRYCINQTNIDKSLKFNLFTNCMTFPPDYRTLGIGKTYSQSLHLKMSVNAEDTADASEARDSKKAGEPNIGVSPELIEEKIKENLEPQSAQISTLTQLLNHLIQDNSAHNYPTPGPLTQPTQPEISPGSEVGASRALPRTSIGSTTSLPDSRDFAACYRTLYFFFVPLLAFIVVKLWTKIWPGYQ